MNMLNSVVPVIAALVIAQAVNVENLASLERTVSADGSLPAFTKTPPEFAEGGSLPAFTKTPPEYAEGGSLPAFTKTPPEHKATLDLIY